MKFQLIFHECSYRFVIDVASFLLMDIDLIQNLAKLVVLNNSTVFCIQNRVVPFLENMLFMRFMPFFAILFKIVLHVFWHRIQSPLVREKSVCVSMFSEVTFLVNVHHILSVGFGFLGATAGTTHRTQEPPIPQPCYNYTTSH